MNHLRKGFRMSVLILAAAAAHPPTTGPAETPTGGIVQHEPVPTAIALVPRLGNLPAGVYTMGASFNYGFLFNEPSSYNHSPILATPADLRLDRLAEERRGRIRHQPGQRLHGHQKCPDSDRQRDCGPTSTYQVSSGRRSM